MKRISNQTMLGNLKLKNRMIRSATWEALADESGHMDGELYSVYEGLATGGVGAIISGFTSVADNDYYFGGMVRLSGDDLITQHTVSSSAALSVRHIITELMNTAEAPQTEDESLWRYFVISRKAIPIYMLR